MASFTDIIRTKRDARALSPGAIEAFVSGLADGSLPTEQAAALAMAIYLNGMDPIESAALTAAMANSGTRIDWGGEALGRPILDKHSTGGVGDKVSLMLAPILAACGGAVPMISGRGLGHTGGTLDKLSAIPGYDPFPGLDRFRAVVREVGCAIIGQTGDLAPADRRLYAIRDITGTIESTPLITASILSKKLAAGVGALVMDIKIGSGAFMPDVAAAEALGRAMAATGDALGLPIRCLVTDMNETLGSTAGNAIEVRETIDYLTGAAREPRLHACVIALAAEMLLVGGLADSRAGGAALAEAALASGAAADRFARMVAALGGPADLIERPDAYLATAPVVVAAPPARAGILRAVDGKAVGEALIDLGGGRRRIEDAIDPAVGFVRVAPIGTSVGPDRPLAMIHARTETAAREAAAALAAACAVGDTPPPERPVVHSRF
ncbi:thymidine phosphorylase [Sphingomonas naphthae]|uniref:Thymidine phosphorylase n=1 Tax=Sphingomonas naphthae TaxID=1813468 RepID=A0ABY7TJP1_9SPHN|nr:thymidine phosphorylase [Sphingomonas naphthae]WCT72927.1 thymidine phosphorylase [Sphingomonas naphthae]